MDEDGSCIICLDPLLAQSPSQDRRFLNLVYEVREPELKPKKGTSGRISLPYLPFTCFSSSTFATFAAMLCLIFSRRNIGLSIIFQVEDLSTDQRFHLFWMNEHQWILGRKERRNENILGLVPVLYPEDEMSMPMVST
jgi:hypothetical protein